MVSRAVNPESIQIHHRLQLPQDTQVNVELHRRRAGEVVCEPLAVRWPTQFDSVDISSTVNDICEYRPVLEALPSNKRDLMRHLRSLTVTMAARAQPPVAENGYFMDLRTVVPNNLSHLLHDAIPLILHAQQVLKAPVTMVTRRISPAFLSVIQAFGIPVLDTEKRVAGHAVRVHACRRLTAYGPQWFDMPAIVFLPHIYEGMRFESPLKAESLFVARRGDRALGNQAEVEALLTAHGYKTVYMEDYSAGEKMGLLAQARRIVGVHGAGMAPAVFGQQREFLMEIMPPHAFNEWFILCMGHTAKRYALLMSEYDPRMSRNGWETLLQCKTSAFSVDLDLLRAALTA